MALEDLSWEQGSKADMVVMGASAGGLAALSAILSKIPVDFPGAILIVQHLSPRHRSLMADILSRVCPLPVKQAQNGEKIIFGTVYVAPPDHHMLVNPDHNLTLAQTELVHFLRPSIDLLFESAAAAYKNRVVGVILTGTGRDGAMGVTAIKRMGGTVIVQDEISSQSFGMPRAAISTGNVDMILPLESIAAMLQTLVSEDGVA